MDLYPSDSTFCVVMDSFLKTFLKLSFPHFWKEENNSNLIRSWWTLEKMSTKFLTEGQTYGKPSLNICCDCNVELAGNSLSVLSKGKMTQ